MTVDWIGPVTGRNGQRDNPGTLATPHETDVPDLKPREYRPWGKLPLNSAPLTGRVTIHCGWDNFGNETSHQPYLHMMLDAVVLEGQVTLVFNHMALRIVAPGLMQHLPELRRLIDRGELHFIRVFDNRYYDEPPPGTLKIAEIKLLEAS